MTLAFADVETAMGRLRGVSYRTPLLRCAVLDEMTGAEVHLKAENLQRTGAFKFRGAYNAVASLDASERERGVVTFSSGNHARAMATAAALCDTTCVVVMPSDTPPEKREATARAGARIVSYDRYAEDREAAARVIAQEEGRVLVPPYDDYRVMAGQGTVAAEIVEDLPDLDELWVCVGGGGLLAGCLTAIRSLQPTVRVVGVEPEAGDDHVRSVRAGERIEIDVPRTIADGQQLTTPGALTWPITSVGTDAWRTVSDSQIVSTMRLLMEEAHVVVEPSGASALAAVLAAGHRLRGRRVAVTLSGGNIGIDRLLSLMSERAPSPDDG